jgi:hypothetical protein
MTSDDFDDAERRAIERDNAEILFTTPEASVVSQHVLA